ncbi:uncharacterized protein LOC127750848 [Frankliniella occidentalis]|uniref:Uncharacterized protein LOC127750848 n=1 Tax=Frankliniella occidentalis TaxID=133901 RepID=A0A9C6XSH7_FRAOC|nr:uncharacterized protein LOC127750848 [Frankliniella occidentalis]
MDRDSSEQVAFGRPNCTKEAEDLPCQGHDVGPCTRNALCTACDRARALFRGPRVQSLQDIITPMLNAMPKRDRPTISANLTPGKNSGLATRVRQKMAAEMEGRLMSMQVDGCSKRHRHFIGVNVQYIKDNETKVRTLAVEELHVRSSAENLKAVLHKILRKYDVPAKNVISVTSDNGANYLLAGGLLNVSGELQQDLQELDGDGTQDDAWLHIEIGTEGTASRVSGALLTLFNLPSTRL